MNPLRKNTLVFVLTNVIAITIPIYLSGCGGAASPMTTAVTGSNTTTGNSGTPGVDNNQNSGTSGTGTSGSGTTTTSGSGTSTSGSGTGTSDSGTTTSSSGTSTSDSGTTTSGGDTGTSDSGTSASGSGTTSTSGSGTSTSDSGTTTTTSGAVAPAQALAVINMQRLSSWDGVYDTGTGGSTSTSTGVMSLTSSPSLSGSARKFVTSYTNNGGERYWVSFGADTVTNNFLYDTWVYLDDSSANIANLEMDMNQVMSNGQTVIYGVQCDGWSGTWDYTMNKGTPAQPKSAWVHVKTAPCNPRKWTKNVWHHVQIEYSRDNAGNVTYKSVWLDGARQDLNVTVPSAFALGWRLGTLLTNFQVDGLGTSGTATVYVDNMTVYRW